MARNSIGRKKLKNSSLSMVSQIPHPSTISLPHPLYLSPPPSFAKGAGAPQLALDHQKQQLADMVELVRQPLPKGDKTKVGALAVIDVHARDVMVKLVAAGTETTADFLWQSQLRYYWEIEESDHADGDLWAMMVAARRP